MPGLRSRWSVVQQTHQVTMYYAGIGLDASKKVASVTLPGISAPASSGPALHVFAMTIGTAPVDLSGAGPPGHGERDTGPLGTAGRSRTYAGFTVTVREMRPTCRGRLPCR